jgi:DNA gyrase subunit A
MHFGRGKVVVRGNYCRSKSQRTGTDHHHEVPYQVNRDALTNRIGELVNEKIIEGYLMSITNQIIKKVQG